MSEEVNDMKIDTVVCILLSIGTILLLSDNLVKSGIQAYWWGFFILCDIGYLIYGMKKGFVKGDLANGMVAASGPIAWYFWTYIMVWRTYFAKKGK